jgi:hypothetical protein
MATPNVIAPFLHARELPQDVSAIGGEKAAANSACNVGFDLFSLCSILGMEIRMIYDRAAGAIGGGHAGYELGEDIYDFLRRYFR